MDEGKRERDITHSGNEIVVWALKYIGMPGKGLILMGMDLFRQNHALQLVGVGRCGGLATLIDIELRNGLSLGCWNLSGRKIWHGWKQQSFPRL